MSRSVTGFPGHNRKPPTIKERLLSSWGAPAPTETQYFRGRLWKVSSSMCRIARDKWRYVKLYERRAAIGKQWELVHHAIYENAPMPGRKTN